MNKNSFSNFCAPLVAENIIFLDEVSSTNDYAKELAKAGCQAGTAVIAARQSAGRGRLGRGWDGGCAKDIYLSLLLKPKFEPSRLTLVAGVSICHTLNGVLHSFGYKALIKWPNDIVVNGRKICGILTENGSFGVVLGIGINVFRESFPSELEDKATSLNLLTDLEHNREVLIKSILSNLSHAYKAFEIYGFSVFFKEYCDLCANIGKQIAVHENDTSYRATATGINSDGKLEILLENGEKRSLDSGEVSVRGIYGYI